MARPSGAGAWGTPSGSSARQIAGLLLLTAGDMIYSKATSTTLYCSLHRGREGWRRGGGGVGEGVVRVGEGWEGVLGVIHQRHAVLRPA